MIFPSEVEIAQAIKEQEAKDTLDMAVKDRKKRSMHVTGKGMKDLIMQMDYFEDDQRKNLRQKYTRSNRDLFARLLRPIDKVFSAKGGAVVLGAKGKKEKDLQVKLDNVTQGIPVRKWIQQFGLQAYLIDPMGLILMEVNDKGDVYPTYKCVDSIYDIVLNGRQPEYVIFKLDVDDMDDLAFRNKIPKEDDRPTDEKYFRVFDDAFDYTVKYSDGIGGPTAVIVEKFENRFEKVPAIVASDMQEFDTLTFTSPIDDVVELANDFLTDNSVFTIFKKLHGFPKSWRYRTQCATCMGTKYVDGQTCNSCQGTGYQKKTTVRDEMIAPIPEQGQPVISEFGGYMTPPIDAWDKMVNEMERVEKLASVVLWGTEMSTGSVKAGATNSQGGASAKTATQSFMDVAPVNDRLRGYSEWAESLEKFITDKIGEVVIGAGYAGASISYGDRYMLEKPDEIWTKYQSARKDGAPLSTLDGLLKDYYEARYQGAGMDYQIAINLMQVEPWVHMTTADVMPLGAASADYHQKLYFNEWLVQQDPMFLADPTKVADMRQSLAEFTAKKTATVQADNAAKVQDMIAVARAKGPQKPEPNDNGDNEGQQDQNDPNEGTENTSP